MIDGCIYILPRLPILSYLTVLNMYIFRSKIEFDYSKSTLLIFFLPNHCGWLQFFCIINIHIGNSACIFFSSAWPNATVLYFNDNVLSYMLLRVPSIKSSRLFIFHVNDFVKQISELELVSFERYIFLKMSLKSHCIFSNIVQFSGNKKYK